VLKNSVAFENKIRNRWHEKYRRKNAQIAELEARVAELGIELEASRANIEEEATADPQTKEHKLIALMVNHLGIVGTDISVVTNKPAGYGSAPGCPAASWTCASSGGRNSSPPRRRPRAYRYSVGRSSGRGSWLMSGAPVNSPVSPWEILSGSCTLAKARSRTSSSTG
jgi:hypothetical protein